MSRIRSTGTKPEIDLRRALWAADARGYRLHRRDLPGRPDLAYGRARVAVFVDGAFWHGHPSAFTHGKSGGYWDAKIARNMARDAGANRALAERNWSVLRFWDFEIRRDLDRCVEQVLERLRASSVGTRCEDARFDGITSLESRPRGRAYP
jgi:DNA mismatch endonuclease (patch repair protein)